MLFQVELTDVRPVKSLRFTLDLDRNAPLCIVGRNGSGKTTLAKAIMNFSLADTFRRTLSDGALHESSSVRYQVGDLVYEFVFDQSLRTLDTRKPVPANLKKLVDVELPIPHGLRFSYFSTLTEAAAAIGTAIVLEQESRPGPLIDFLTNIYGDSRFDELREVKFARGSCCFYRTDQGRYVREDYFSSGEFFLVSLFRRMQSGKSRLIFIDEIDISLDAAAQARLMGQLRILCTQFAVNVVFTSHSLALMQTLRAGELLHLETAGQKTQLEARSFAYVKSLMFGFQGFDRYILVEDEACKLVVQRLIELYCVPVYFSYHIIHVGGAGQVVSLLQRNRDHGFLASADSVIAILDGDQAGKGHTNEPNTYCMPLWTLESAFATAYNQPGFSAPRLPPSEEAVLPADGRHKALFKKYRRYHLQTDAQIVDLACASQAEKMGEFARTVLRPFVGPQAPMILAES